MTSWFGDFADALTSGKVHQEVHGLRQAVDEGKLVMDPEAAERVAKVYEDKADDVHDELRNANRLLVECVWRLRYRFGFGTEV